jgi:hypothetical protein
MRLACVVLAAPTCFCYDLIRLTRAVRVRPQRDRPAAVPDDGEARWTETVGEESANSSSASLPMLRKILQQRVPEKVFAAWVAACDCSKLWVPIQDLLSKPTDGTPIRGGFGSSHSEICCHNSAWGEARTEEWLDC